MNSTCSEVTSCSRKLARGVSEGWMPEQREVKVKGSVLKGVRTDSFMPVLCPSGACLDGLTDLDMNRLRRFLVGN